MSKVEKPYIKYMRSFTREQRRAIWQYLMDHNRKHKGGLYNIHLVCRDEKDFWRRIHARSIGYKVKKTAQEELHNSVVTANIQMKKNKKRNRMIVDIEKNGTLFKKFLWYIHRKITKYLFTTPIDRSK